VRSTIQRLGQHVEPLCCLGALDDLERNSSLLIYIVSCRLALVTAIAYEQLKSALKASSAGRMTAFGAWGSSRSNRGWTSRGGLGCSPVPGQQLGQTRSRPALGHTIYDVGEIGLRIEPVEPSRFDDRVDVCRAQATFVAAQEEEVLPCYGDGPVDGCAEGRLSGAERCRQWLRRS
jgi:hypothetical protein